ncbi:CBS domain-containing protein cbsx1, chloroplastic [Dionaea muscipula]
MGSILVPDPFSLSPLRTTTSAAASNTPVTVSAPFCLRPSRFLLPRAGCVLPQAAPSETWFRLSYGGSGVCRSSPIAASTTVMGNSTPRNGVYIVGDFMTRKDKLHVVKPSTTVDEALEALVDHRITGFPVVDDDWKLVGVVSDYDLLALDSISGGGRSEGTSMFPEVDSTWKVFNEIHKLLSKTNGQVVADVMTPSPLVARETTNLEDAARLLLETRYRRLPVVDADGKLVGIITRGNVIRAALHIKRNSVQA